MQGLCSQECKDLQYNLSHLLGGYIPTDDKRKPIYHLPGGKVLQTCHGIQLSTPLNMDEALPDLPQQP